MADKKVQPKSPQNEGVDPLTKGEKLYPRVNTKLESEKLRKQETEATHDTTSDDKTAETVDEQNEVNAKANTPNEMLSGDDQKSTDSDTPKGKTSGSKTSSR